ncbi:MAG TPA: hypothetical protein VHR45_09780 [Thermoanaerobaculia bacterium]|nr:hypothetical protein [Thermoanaerobaculia bacterium]
MSSTAASGAAGGGIRRSLLTLPRLAVIALVASWVVLGCILAYRAAGNGLDDFFISYRYSLNLADGKGFVFNPGERVFGLTNPGLALLLALLRIASGRDVPQLATVVFAAALVLLAALLMRAAAAAGRLAEAALAGTLLVSSSYLWAQQGGEGIPMLTLLVAAANLVEDLPVLAGLAAGLAVWFRPEAALGVAFLFVLLMLERRRIPWRFAAAATVTILLGVCWAWIYFGTPIPNSLAAKQAMATGLTGSWSGSRFWLRATRLVPRHAGPFWPLLVAMGVAGAWPLARWGGRSGRLVVFMATVLAIFYPLTGVPFFPWYTIPAAVLVLYGIPYFTGALVRMSSNRIRTNWRRVLVGAVVGLLAWIPVAISLVPTSYSWLRHSGWFSYMERYKLAGLWLRQHSKPNATVAYYEVGALGYFSDRTIVDLLGIVTPDLLSYARAGDFANGFLARPAEFAIFDQVRGGLMPIAEEWFKNSYDCVARVGSGSEQLLIFHRRQLAVLPPPGSPRQRPPAKRT